VLTTSSDSDRRGTEHDRESRTTSAVCAPSSRENHNHRERERAATIRTVPIPWAGGLFERKNINIYFFQIKYTESILSNTTRKPLRYEITKMLTAVSKKNKFVVLFAVIFGTLSFPAPKQDLKDYRQYAAGLREHLVIFKRIANVIF